MQCDQQRTEELEALTYELEIRPTVQIYEQVKDRAAKLESALSSVHQKNATLSQTLKDIEAEKSLKIEAAVLLN